MLDEKGPVDPGRQMDWNRSARDYASYRPGPPPSFYARLAALGIGLPGQRILDLGTGTGVLARQFARQGAAASGVDLSEGQLEMARRLAAEEGLHVDFRRGPAEAVPFEVGSFDVVSGNQCWHFFDKPRTIAEARRLLVPGGRVVTSHFSWLPRRDAVARRTEELALEFNPGWRMADWSGEVPPIWPWAEADFDLRGMFCYDEPMEFTRETWRGRWRACGGIGASLPAAEVARFDEAHERLLRATVPERFTVLHRIDAHVLEFKR